MPAASVIQRLLPDGVRVDTFDGAQWERPNLNGTVALFGHGARPTGEVSISRSDCCDEFVERHSGA
jgi:hypothetical protein